jgi:hypothetical protein
LRLLGLGRPRLHFRRKWTGKRFLLQAGIFYLWCVGGLRWGAGSYHCRRYQ